MIPTEVQRLVCSGAISYLSCWNYSLTDPAVMRAFLLRLPIAPLLLFCLALPSPLRGDGRTETPLSLQPQELQWHSNPKLHGLETTVLAGDPSRPEPYAQRIRLQPGTRLEPHFHPNPARMVTVLEGTLFFAIGERFDAARLKAMPPGSFFTEPAGVAHFAVAGDREVVLQLNAIGPDATTYVGREGQR